MLTIEELIEKLTSPRLIEQIKSGELKPVLNKKEIEAALKTYHEIGIDEPITDDYGMVIHTISSKTEEISAFLLLKDTSGLIVPFYHDSNIEDYKIKDVALKTAKIIEDFLNSSENISLEEFETQLYQALEPLDISEEARTGIIKNLLEAKKKERDDEQAKLAPVETGKMYKNFSFD